MMVRIFNLLQAAQPSWYIDKYTHSNFNNFTKFNGEMKLVRELSYSCKSWFGLEDFGGTNIGVTGLPASTILLQIVQEN